MTAGMACSPSGVAGVPVVLAEGPMFGLVHFRLRAEGGALCAPEAPSRVAALLDLVERGDGSLPESQWHGAMEDTGSRLSLRVGARQAELSLLVPEAHVEAALALVTRALVSPRPAPGLLRQVLAESRSQWRMMLETPGGRVEAVSGLGLYPETAWGTSVLRMHAALRRDEVAARLESLRAAVWGGSWVLGIAAEDPTRWVDAWSAAAASLRRRWPARAHALPVLRPCLRGGLAVGTGAGMQASLRVLGPAPDQDAAVWPAARVGVECLGGGFATPLLRRVRSERGLCYDIQTRLLEGAGGETLWELSGSPASREVAALWAESRRAWDELVGGLQEEDVARARRSLHVRALSRSETAVGRLEQAVAAVGRGQAWDQPWVRAAQLQVQDRSAVRAGLASWGWGTGVAGLRVAAVAGSARSGQWKGLGVEAPRPVTLAMLDA
jgi:predicted Zn-dependent peptidase